MWCKELSAAAEATYRNKTQLQHQLHQHQPSSPSTAAAPNTSGRRRSSISGSSSWDTTSSAAATLTPSITAEAAGAGAGTGTGTEVTFDGGSVTSGAITPPPGAESSAPVANPVLPTISDAAATAVRPAAAAGGGRSSGGGDASAVPAVPTLVAQQANTRNKLGAATAAGREDSLPTYAEVVSNGGDGDDNRTVGGNTDDLARVSIDMSGGGGHVHGADGNDEARTPAPTPLQGRLGSRPQQPRFHTVTTCDRPRSASAVGKGPPRAGFEGMACPFGHGTGGGEGMRVFGGLEAQHRCQQQQAKTDDKSTSVSTDPARCSGVSVFFFVASLAGPLRVIVVVVVVVVPRLLAVHFGLRRALCGVDAATTNHSVAV